MLQIRHWCKIWWNPSVCIKFNHFILSQVYPLETILWLKFACVHPCCLRSRTLWDNLLYANPSVAFIPCLGVPCYTARWPRSATPQPDGLCRCCPLCPDNIDHIPFQQALQNCDPVALIDLENSNDDAIKSFCDNLYDFAKLNPHHQGIPPGEDERNEDEVPYTTSAASHWQRIMSSSNDKALWKAIIWQGSVDECTGDSPPDGDFKTHLETITNPDNTEELNPNDYNTNVYVPVLDSPIQAHEVSYVIEKQIKPNKSAGIDGICPSLFMYLSMQWILVLTVILNCIFWSGYPVCWTYSRLKMLFKKGSRLSCDNYRGISIIDCMSKVYDYILYNRLVQWFQPDKEQAGAQPKRAVSNILLHWG